MPRFVRNAWMEVEANDRRWSGGPRSSSGDLRARLYVRAHGRPRLLMDIDVDIHFDADTGRRDLICRLDVVDEDGVTRTKTLTFPADLED